VNFEGLKFHALERKSVHESEFTSAAHDARRAELVTAGHALVTWVHEQAATWPEIPLQPVSEEAWETSGPAVPLSHVAAPLPQLTAIAAEQLAVTPADLERAVVAPASPPKRRFALPRRIAWPGRIALPDFGWLRRISWRACAAVCILALAGVAGGRAWTLVTTYWSEMTAPPKPGMAVLDSLPPGSDIFIDGKAAGKTPTTAELPPGRHVIEFRRRNEARTLEIEVVSGQSTLGQLDWSTKPTGRLVVRSDPDNARVSIDGRPRGITPLTVDDLTIGSHTVVIEGDRGSVRRSVTIQAGQETELSESIYAGWIHVSTPFEVQVTVGGRGVQLDSRSEALLPPGVHELSFESRALGFKESRRVEVKPGATTAVSLAPGPSPLTVTATAPAEVLIDGEPVGVTPLIDHPVALGTHEITIRAVAGVERRVTLTMTSMPARLDIDFSRP
jgi:hypothetical protein